MLILELQTSWLAQQNFDSFTNQDPFTHTAHASDGSEDISPTIPDSCSDQHLFSSIPPLSSNHHHSAPPSSQNDDRDQTNQVCLRTQRRKTRSVRTGEWHGPSHVFAPTTTTRASRLRPYRDKLTKWQHAEGCAAYVSIPQICPRVRFLN